MLIDKLVSNTLSITEFRNDTYFYIFPYGNVTMNLLNCSCFLVRIKCLM